MTLLSDTAYPSFIGEVEALDTTTIRRLIPSARHQLPAIAPTQRAVAAEVAEHRFWKITAIWRLKIDNQTVAGRSSLNMLSPHLFGPPDPPDYEFVKPGLGR